jgi:uncharacterized protein YhbP (UPF0306 family)
VQAKELVESYLIDAKLMQIATVSDGKPWICTVYFVSDSDNNLFWLSHPVRRHSQEIEKYPNIAVAIAVKHDQPIIGIQAEGLACIVKDAEIVKDVMSDYVAKYGNGKDFYDNFVAGTNQHNLYKFAPSSIVLFDEVNFADDPRQTVKNKWLKK